MLKVTGNTADLSVTISTTEGKILWQRQKVNASNLLLPVSDQPAGVYFVTINNGKEQKVLRLVVKQ